MSLQRPSESCPERNLPSVQLAHMLQQVNTYLKNKQIFCKPEIHRCFFMNKNIVHDIHTRIAVLKHRN